MPNLDLSGAISNDDRVLPRQLLDLAGLLEGEQHCDSPSWRKLSPLVSGAIMAHESLCPNRTRAGDTSDCPRRLIEEPI